MRALDDAFDEVVGEFRRSNSGRGGIARGDYQSQAAGQLAPIRNYRNRLKFESFLIYVQNE
jgi:hypothetical protein